MARRPFLDRFRAPASHEPWAPVVRNLEGVLNTREGHGAFQRGLGLGDFSGDRGGQELVPFLTEALQRQVLNHEPRLSDVELKLEGQDGALHLHFEVKGQLDGELLRLRLRFDTVTGRVRVERKD